VASAVHSQVTYGGKALASRTPAFWRVRVWDERGAASVRLPGAADRQVGSGDHRFRATLPS
jgi:hypothetical protein